MTVTDIIPVPGGSLVRAICVEPGGDFVYAISTGSDIASVIDTATNTVIATIGVGDAPRGIAFSPNGETAYVPTLTDVYVIRTSDHTVTTAVTTPGDALSGIDVTPDGQFVYATAIFSDSVHVIRAPDNTLIDNIV